MKIENERKAKEEEQKKQRDFSDAKNKVEKYAKNIDSLKDRLADFQKFIKDAGSDKKKEKAVAKARDEVKKIQGQLATFEKDA